MLALIAIGCCVVLPIIVAGLALLVGSPRALATVRLDGAGPTALEPAILWSIGDAAILRHRSSNSSTVKPACRSTLRKVPTAISR